jgi:hypothetical protein
VGPERGRDVQRPSRRRINPTIVALVGGIAVLLLSIAYFATNRNPDQDKLSDNLVSNELAQTREAAPEKRCSSQTTYDLIKRELFRRAAEQRGNNQAAYDQLAGYAVVRMENAVLESENSASGALNCSGSLSLDLPPDVVAAGDKRTLRADIDYTLDVSSGLTLRNADAIIGALATLSHTAPLPEMPDANAVVPESEGNVAASESARTQPSPPIAYPGRPSFDCSAARSRGEIAVCSDSGLSALDLNMTTQYHRAQSMASPEQQALLEQTGRRFSAYRDRCPDRQCIADAYLGRMREIRDIMEGR